MSQRYYSKDQDITFKPIDAAEEKQLFIDAKGGDEEAREFLIRNHLLFAMMTARSLVHGDLPDNEIVSAANFAVMEAIDGFNPHKGNRFTTYLRFFIRGQVARLWSSKFSGNLLDPSISKVGPTDARDPVLNIADESPTVEELDLMKFNRTALAAALKTLPEKKAVIVRQYYLEGRTLEKIGAKHKLTRQRIQQILVQSLKLLRRRLEKGGVGQV